MPTWLLVCLAVAVGLPWVLGPVLVRFTQRLQARPSFEPVEPQAAPVPQEIWQFFTATLRALAPQGFTEAGYFVQRGLAPNVESWLLALEHRPLEEAAIAVGMLSTAPGAAGLKTRYVEFSAAWKDDRVVSANNSDVLPSFAPVPLVTTLQFPELADPARLLRVHRALVARAGVRAARRYHPPGEFKQFLEEGAARELSRQLVTGYLALVPERTHYLPTWKGAVLMTWGLLFPVTAIRKALRRSRNARLLRELGV